MTASSNDQPTVSSWFRRFWDALIAEPMRRMEREASDFRNSSEGEKPDWKVMTVLATVAVSLSLLNYFGSLSDHRDYERVEMVLSSLGGPDLAELLSQTFHQAADAHLNRLTYWVAACVVCYFILPALVVKLVFRERLGDYGVKLRGALAGLWVYGVMFAIMVPLILAVSMNSHFQKTYPFYRIAPSQSLWPSFWRWELQYAVQFFALEFFFRGFMLHGLRRRFGTYAIFVMMVPYCMIHFGKPMPEAFASILAGIVLGFMSLKTRSIWLGAAIHVTVALSMDITSMWRQGLLAASWPS